MTVDQIEKLTMSRDDVITAPSIARTRFKATNLGGSLGHGETHNA